MVRSCVVVLALAGCASGGAPDGPGAIDAAPLLDVFVVDSPLTIDAAPDAPAGTSCAAVTTCPAATALASVSGDSGSQVVNANGYVSTWFSIRVTEDDSDVFAVPMGIQVQLASPVGSNFDLYVYVNTGSDVVSCTTPSKSSTNPAGSVDSALIQWGESGTFSNGNEDDRTVSIEVRAPATTTCSSSATWQLAVYGNQ